MALVMQQKASICGFNAHLSLNMCVFVEQLGAQKGRLLLFVSMVNLNDKPEWYWFKISRKLTADVMSGMIVSVSSTYLL